MWDLDGPYFVRFAARLIHYEGAVRAQITIDYSDQAGDSVQSKKITFSGSKSQKMSMSDAMKQYSNSDDLDVLNHESESAMGGTLFERVSVPAN